MQKRIATVLAILACVTLSLTASLRGLVLCFSDTHIAIETPHHQPHSHDDTHTCDCCAHTNSNSDNNKPQQENQDNSPCSDIDLPSEDIISQGSDDAHTSASIDLVVSATWPQPCLLAWHNNSVHAYSYAPFHPPPPHDIVAMIACTVLLI